MSVDQPAAQFRSTAPKKRKPIASGESPCRKASIAGLSAGCGRADVDRRAVPEGDVDGRGIEGLCARVAVARALMCCPALWRIRPLRGCCPTVWRRPSVKPRTAPADPPAFAAAGPTAAPARTSRRRPADPLGETPERGSVSVSDAMTGGGADDLGTADSSSASIEK